MTGKYIDEPTALHVLCARGDYSLAQAKIILGHSLKKVCNGAPHYPAKYIHERANAA